MRLLRKIKGTVLSALKMFYFISYMKYFIYRLIYALPFCSVCHGRSFGRNRKKNFSDIKITRKTYAGSQEISVQKLDSFLYLKGWPSFLFANYLKVNQFEVIQVQMRTIFRNISFSPSFFLSKFESESPSRFKNLKYPSELEKTRHTTALIG